MRGAQLFYWLLAFITTVHAFALPGAFSTFSEASSALWKRKGGGGSRGGGSTSSGSSGSGSTGSSGGRTGSTGAGTGTGTNGAARGSSVSNTGGRTVQGSGPPRSFGNSYKGGASVPYNSGATRSGVSPLLIAAPLAIFPGLWLYGAYAYSWGHPYNYYNRTSGRNESMPATCLCEQYQECGCDDNNSTDYQTAVANNDTVSKVSDVNGTQTLVINGTLPNGTTADGGDEDAFDNLATRAVQMSGFWVVIAGVTYAVQFL